MFIFNLYIILSFNNVFGQESSSEKDHLPRKISDYAHCELNSPFIWQFTFQARFAKKILFWKKFFSLIKKFLDDDVSRFELMISPLYFDYMFDVSYNYFVVDTTVGMLELTKLSLN